MAQYAAEIPAGGLSSITRAIALSHPRTIDQGAGHGTRVGCALVMRFQDASQPPYMQMGRRAGCGRVLFVTFGDVCLLMEHC